MVPVFALAFVFAAIAGTAHGTPTTLGGYAVLFATAAAVGLWVRRKVGGGRHLAGRSVRMRGHSHGPAGPRTARHEAGHMAAARGLGGRVVSARADEHGGYVEARMPGDPRSRVAFWLAGQYAAGTSRGAGVDDSLIRAELGRVPRGQRGGVRRDAERMARRVVGSSAGQIRRDAQRLQRHGRA